MTRAHGVPRPPIRLRAVPALDPPFEDELAPAWTVGAPGQLTLDLASPAGVSRPPGGPRPNRRRPLGPLPLPPAALATASPESRHAARRFLLICLEIFNGRRPVSHIRPLAGRGETESVVEELSAGLDRLGMLRRRLHQRGQPVALRRMRVCEPRAGVTEAAAAINSGGRTWAVAFRLERRRGTWAATVLRVL